MSKCDIAIDANLLPFAVKATLDNLLALRGEVADLAITATKMIIGESLDEAKQKALIDKYVEKIPKSTRH